MLMTFIVPLMFQALAGSAPPFDVQVRAACVAPMGARPAISGIKVSPFPAAPGDLPGLRVAYLPAGAWMNVYHDALSAEAAHTRAACIGAQLAYLHGLTGDDRTGAEWANAVFTADPDYIAPVGARRWRVPTQGGAISNDTDNFLLVVLPHEQVHHFQQRNGANTPRWFHEGHAEWVGRLVSQIISLDRAAWDAASAAEDLDEATAPVALGHWGGIVVKREAIMRQVSPEDRRRMEADPAYTPDVPVKIGPGDMISDESNLSARYEAAWRIFRDMESTYGSNRLRAWVKEITSKGGEITPAAVLNAAILAFDFNLSDRLE